MARDIFSPQAQRDLLFLNATEDEFRSIYDAIKDPDKKHERGFKIWPTSAFLPPKEVQYRYVVGRFRLNCTVDPDTGKIRLASVMRD